MQHILISLLIITFISCRSYRKNTQQENKRISLSEANKGIRYGFQQIEKDSLDRTWYFATDSVMYFHPDAGLYSNGGHLSLRESRIGLHQLQAEVDSFEKEKYAHALAETKRQSHTWYRNSWCLWGIGLLGVMITCWGLRTRSLKKSS